MRLLAAAFAIVSAGCTSTGAPENYWVRTNDSYRAEQVEIRYEDVAGMVALGCDHYSDACTLRQADRCLIVIWSQKKADDCIVSHELMHCAGYSHPRYNYFNPSGKRVCGIQEIGKLRIM